MENVIFKSSNSQDWEKEVENIFDMNFGFIPDISNINFRTISEEEMELNYFTSQNSYQQGCMVFVSFNSLNEKEIIMSKKPGFFRKLYVLKDKIIHFSTRDGEVQTHVPTRCKTIFYNNQTIKIVNPPHPQNILWENLHYKRSNLILRRLLIAVIIVAMMIISFFLVYYLSALYNYYYQWYLQENYNSSVLEDLDNNKQKSQNYLKHHHKINSTQTYQQQNKQLLTTQEKKEIEQFLEHPSFIFELQKSLIHFVITLSIIGLGELFEYILYLLTYFEKHSSQVQFNISLSWKNSFAWFWNIGLQLFIIQILVVWFQGGKDFKEGFNLAKKNIFQPGGLLYLQNSMFRANAIIKPLLYLFELKPIPCIGRAPMYWKKFHIWRITRNGKKQQYTENEIITLKDHYSRLDYEIADRYAYIVNTMFMTAFYAPLFPLSIFYSILSIVVMYYIERYKLLNHNYVKAQVSSRLSLEVLDMLKWFLIFFCLGNYIFQYIIVDTQQISEVEKKGINKYLPNDSDTNNVFLPYSSLVGILIGLIHALLPYNNINDKLFNVQPVQKPNFFEDGKEYQLPYNKAKIHFTTTFDSENKQQQPKWKQSFIEQCYSNEDSNHKFQSELRANRPYIKYSDINKKEFSSSKSMVINKIKESPHSNINKSLHYA